MLRLLFLLWVALLAFGLPEVFAGTGNGWLTRPDVYILALPLYALHFLLLCHVAVKTRRTSWPALYLFGVLFGLYETWITKVVWNGYPGSNGFSMGSFGEWFGVHETLGLVLFYHPVTSFLLPLAVVSRLFPAFGAHFPVPDWVFGNTRWALARRIGLLLIWGIISGHNMPILAEYLLSWLPMIVLLGVGYTILKPHADSAIASPVLGRWGLVIASVWLGLIYLLSYLFLLPELLPPPHIQLITLAAYPVLILFLWREPPRKPVPSVHPPATPFRWLLAVFFTGLIATVLLGLDEQVRVALAIIPFVTMVPLGVILFIWLVLWKSVFRRRAIV